jgi:peptidoglycan/LPS O-acetylase OafA/YrhL
VAAPGRDPAERFRPDIQGLRAVAVVLVVLYHLWPLRLTGGYVGVDVFFVISGYLITAHLYREIVKTGTVSLRRFWARRIRRLLPASLLVLLVSTIAVVRYVPATLWSQASREIAASALYIENWALARDQVHYMAAEGVPTVAQHYWSLSIEEQFYVVWPLLLVAILLAYRRVGREHGKGRGALIVGLSILSAASLACSVVSTNANQASGYFLTQARAWEFAAGALVALAVPGQLASPRWNRWQGPLVAGGLAAILFAGFRFDGATPFPGWVALLPVLGAVAVIVGGSSTPRRTVPVRALSIRPMAFIGDISYSIYLWHWALIVVWPYATGASPHAVSKLIIIGLTVLLAWLTKTFVEDPGRRNRWLVASPWRTMACAAAGMAIVVLATVAMTSELHRRKAESDAAHAEAVVTGCFGPSALAPGNRCDPVEGVGPLVPPPEVVASEVLYPGCMGEIKGRELVTCVIGSKSETPDRVVAIVGDSHATAWLSAFDEIGVSENWRVVTYTKASCPLTAAIRTFDKSDGAELDCQDWVASVTKALVESDEISYVFVAAYSNAYTFEAPAGVTLADPRVGGFAAKESELADAGLQVVVLADVPLTQGPSVPTCLAENPDDRMACSMPRSRALPGSAPAAAALQLDDPRVHVIDLSDQFCDTDTCYPVVGDLIVYRDYSHISDEYARALIPYLLDGVDEAEQGRQVDATGE